MIGILAGESSGLRIGNINVSYYFPTFPFFVEQWLLRKHSAGFRSAYSDELASDLNGIPRYAFLVRKAPYKQKFI